MSYYTECLKKFSDLPADLKDKISNIETVKKINELEAEFKVSLQFLIILVLVGEIKIKEIPVYLEKKYKISQKDAIRVKEEMNNKIFSLLISNPQKDLAEISQKLKNDFTENLLKILHGEYSDIEELNIKILYLFSIENLLTHEDLLKVLNINQEKLTKKALRVGGHSVNSTIENWIKDFIRENGSGNFDNLNITKYITNSPNGKVLSGEEKKLVQKLLMLYRNLRFFPDSFKDKPVEEWEIIPLEKDVESLGKARQVSGPPKTEEEMEIDELKAEEERYAEGGIERLALEEEVGKKKKVEDLKIEAGKYRDGSLEKKALLEEIRKLDK